MAKNSDAAEGGPTRVVEGRLNTLLQNDCNKLSNGPG